MRIGRLACTTLFTLSVAACGREPDRPDGATGSGGAQSDAGPDSPSEHPGSGGSGSGGSGSGGTIVASGSSEFSALPPLDILFMIDDSPSMEGFQQKAEQALAPIMQALRTAGPVPSLHIGVVSSDQGTGAVTNGVPGCVKQPYGDMGALRRQPGFTYQWDATTSKYTRSTKDCAGPADAFIAMGERETQPNFSGSVEDVFACIAPIGASGCGFESQLGSVLQALGADPSGRQQPAANVGFLRTDGHLAIVLITNEDDCSIPADSVFADPNSRDERGQFGPLASYRCNAFGHLCAGSPPPKVASDPRFQGGESWVGQSCTANEDGTLVRIADVRNALLSLKPRREMVHLNVIAGPSSAYEVKLDATLPAASGVSGQLWPKISPSCAAQASGGAPASTADPAVRLQGLATLFGPQGTFNSICAEQFSAVMGNVAMSIATHARLHCADEVQATSTQCVVTVSRNGGPATQVPECESAVLTESTPPCWHRPASGLCGSGREIALYDDQPLAESTTVSVTCH